MEVEKVVKLNFPTFYVYPDLVASILTNSQHNVKYYIIGTLKCVKFGYFLNNLLYKSPYFQDGSEHWTTAALEPLPLGGKPTFSKI